MYISLLNAEGHQGHVKQLSLVSSFQNYLLSFSFSVVFIVCNVSFIVCVALYAVLCLSVVIFCVTCVFFSYCSTAVTG
jgi:predicted branched-subunit amino acid permease